MSDDAKALIAARLATAEAAVDRMYDARDLGEAEFQFSLAKDCYRDAIKAADEAGLKDESAEIMKRLMNVKGAARTLIRR